MLGPPCVSSVPCSREEIQPALVASSRSMNMLQKSKLLAAYEFLKLFHSPVNEISSLVIRDLC